MAVAATLISMLAHVAAHRYGFEFWGIRTTAMVDSQARVLHWAVTGRPAPSSAESPAVAAPRTGPVVGGGAAQTRAGQARRRPGPEVPPDALPDSLPGVFPGARRLVRYLTATGLSGEPHPLVNGSGVASTRNVYWPSAAQSAASSSSIQFWPWVIPISTMCSRCTGR